METDSDLLDGWETDLHPSALSSPDRMLAGVGGHVSTDIHHFIESYEWYDRVHLKNCQAELIGPSV